MYIIEIFNRLIINKLEELFDDTNEIIINFSSKESYS